MAQPSPENVADIVLGRRVVYGLDVDSRIRQGANRLTARALFEILARMDDESPEFATRLPTLLVSIGGEELSGFIGFNSGDIASEGEGKAAQEPERPTEYYLRLVFDSEDAAYYQFPLFPDLEAPYVLGASRKRAGAAQHLRLELSRPEALQSFLESCRTNPHFLRVEQSTAEDFDRAPSNAV